MLVQHMKILDFIFLFISSAVFLAVFIVVSVSVSYAQSNPFPQYFEVSGIKQGDVLNVRSGPSTKYRVVGNLKSGSGTIEILEISEDKKWGRVLWAESNGWLYTEYLRAVSPVNLKNTMVPLGLHCSGTEPYWDFAIESQTNVSFKELFSDLIENSTIESVAESNNKLNFPTALLATSDKVKLTAVLNTQQCNDGMTDRTYGWEIDLLVTQDANSRLLSGCCSM